MGRRSVSAHALEQIDCSLQHCVCADYAPFLSNSHSARVAFHIPQLSFRSVQLASQLMHQLNDNLVIVTLGRESSAAKDQEMFDRFKSRAQDVAMKNGVPLMRIHIELVKIPESMPFEKGLLQLGNAHDNGSSVLVLGAAGKGDEEKRGRKPEGQPPMGHLATACLQQSKVPVVLVKSGPKVDLDVPRIKRAGRDGTPGLTFCVTVDNSTVSGLAFDLACATVQKGDTLYGFHVKDNDRGALGADFGPTLTKLEDTGACKKAEFVIEPKSKSIREHIEDFIDEKSVDVIIMGSVELSNPNKGHYIGSVSSAVTKASLANCCVVKHFATT